MGRFLRTLRKGKGLSLEELSSEFDKVFLTASTNAISSWENGKTIPEINNLNFLAEFYGLTIDELLDGEKHEKIDFESKYFLHKPYSAAIDALFDQALTRKDIHLEYTKQALSIKKNTKDFIFKYINETASQAEIDELVFLLEHYYNLNPDLSIRTFLQKLAGYRNYGLSKDDLWWIIQRDFRPIGRLNVSFGDISDESYKQQTVDMAVDSLEDWEKDMLLAMLQRKDPIYLDPTQYSSKTILKYQEEHGKEFDPEQITKDTMRYLIHKGACINTAYAGYDDSEEIEVRPIEEYEDLYNRFEKPLSFVIEENGQRKYYLAENTYRNHVLINYRYSIVKPLIKLGYSYDEVINMIVANEDIPDDVYLRAAKGKGINIDRDFTLVRADVHWDYLYMQREWDQCREEFLAYPDDDAYEPYNFRSVRESVLANGGTAKALTAVWIGGHEPNEVEDYVLSKNDEMTYSEFKSHRKKIRTQKLLDSLDEMDLDEIRDCFFRIRGNDDD